MCGIAGFWQRGGFRSDEAVKLLELMALQIVSRGPDDSGTWVDPGSGMALAHRRLSIVDLTDAGHQPMFSHTGRYVTVFNGEIYNHLDLRATLNKVQCVHWRGYSDTETLLTGFDVWGVEDTLQKAAGMFAFAVWDRQSRSLILGRDRMGEKPLYYGWLDTAFIFGSELKALKPHPQFSPDIERGALCLLLRHNYIPAPYSIYQGIYKLLPGHFLILHEDQREWQLKPYWSFADVAVKGQADVYSGSPEDAVNELEACLRKVVAEQMTADVPLGAFLSGGIDSSAIVALMQSQSVRPVKTFSIGFTEESYNEAKYAKAVALHLGTDHTELYVTPKQALDVIPLLPSLYDEPFSDSSQIPTFLIAQMTRQHVTVALSGDGGDELFGGYNRYLAMSTLWKRLSHVPFVLRSAAAWVLDSLPLGLWDKSMPFVPQADEKMRKVSCLLSSMTAESAYVKFASHWNSPADVVLEGKCLPTVFDDPSRWPILEEPVHRMMFIDAMTYLHGDILCKVDRATMGVSLEARVPYLDQRVVELAWRLPLSMKICSGETKWILRQILYRYVPKKLMVRPKMGFAVPLAVWLRGPLREWAENLLDPQRLRREGFFLPEAVQMKWAEHLSGKRNWQYHLWDVLMFQAWLDRELS